MRFLLLLLIAGCAGISESECRGTDWAALGKRDGSVGMNWQIDQLAHACSRFGVKVDEAGYLQAWREAYSDWSMRTNPTDN
jgi:hypothetical protein